MTTITTTPKQDAQHELNPLHVYCRLLDAGMSKGMARRLSGWWSMVVWPHLYRERCA